MNVVREISRINQTELDIAIKSPSGSWHQQYSDSAYIFIGGLPYDLTEGDVITIFSQYGEIVDVNLPRANPKQDDRAESSSSSSQQKQPVAGKGKHRGFGFLMYEDQRSTVLAVDNLNGAQVLGRTLRVDHVAAYKQPKVVDEEGRRVDADVKSFNAAPAEMGLGGKDEADEAEADLEDPMAAYIQRQRRDESSTSRHDDEHEREEKRRRKEERARIRAEREERRRVTHKNRSSHRDDRERKHHRSHRQDQDDNGGEGVNRYEQMKKSRSVLDAHRDVSSHPRSRSRSRSRSPQRSTQHREDRSRRDDDRDTHSHHRRRRDEHRSQPSTTSSDRYDRTGISRRRSPSPL